jgi:hypothetical protein
VKGALARAEKPTENKFFHSSRGGHHWLFFMGSGPEGDR